MSLLMLGPVAAAASDEASGEADHGRLAEFPSEGRLARLSHSFMVASQANTAPAQG